MGEETTLRDFNRELGEHDARLNGLSEDVTEIKSDVKEILSALKGHEVELAKNQVKQSWMTGGLAVAASAALAYVQKQLGIV